MFKKLIIHLFDLDDIKDMLLKAKNNQKKLDDRYWSEKLQENEERLKREHELEIQEYQAQISMLQDQVNDYKNRERELDKKEFWLKKQTKENSFMATKIASKVEDFGLNVMKIVGEMKGIKQEAEDHKVKIESK